MVSGRKLSDMIHLRSFGYTIAETAFRLGVFPWNVSYLTRFVKMCVSTEEMMWLEEEMNANKFSTVGEFVMDVFNRTYEEYYLPMVNAKKKKKVA